MDSTTFRRAHSVRFRRRFATMIEHDCAAIDMEGACTSHARPQRHFVAPQVDFSRRAQRVSGLTLSWPAAENAPKSDGSLHVRSGSHPWVVVDNPLRWVPIRQRPWVHSVLLLDSRAARESTDAWMSTPRILTDLTEQVLAIHQLRRSPHNERKRSPSRTNC